MPSGEESMFFHPTASLLVQRGYFRVRKGDAMKGCWVYWQSETDYRWYVRLIDFKLFTRAIGGQGFVTWLKALEEMDVIETILAAPMRKLPRYRIADPYAYARRAVG